MATEVPQAPAARPPAGIQIAPEPFAARRLRLPATAPVNGPAPVPAGGPGGTERTEPMGVAAPLASAVRSVDRAVALLLALGDSPAEAGVTELARALGLHKSTASRLLSTLQGRGLVEQDGETGRYRLGLVLVRLAEQAEKTLDLRTLARPDLERLARVTRETVGLGVLDGDRCLTVAQVDGPNLVACADRTGRTAPLHCAASGKVLLAAMAERDILRFARKGLASCTERTITTVEPLFEELARVRRRGFAAASSEFEPGQNAVAVPVHDARGRVVAAVEIWGPAYRIAPARVRDLVTEARTAAGAISIRLGGASA